MGKITDLEQFALDILGLYLADKFDEDNIMERGIEYGLIESCAPCQPVGCTCADFAYNGSPPQCMRLVVR